MADRDGLHLHALRARHLGRLPGRYGLLVDFPEDGGPDALPYIAGYKAETIINWSIDGDFYVLDETHLERDKYEWDEVEHAPPTPETIN
jgi:hypothetical protein